MILDTHEAVEKMVEAGASKKMAEAIVKTLNSSSDNLATKTDLFQVKTELRSEIAEVRSELKVLATQFATMKWMQYTILGLLFAPMVAQFLAMYFK